MKKKQTNFQLIKILAMLMIVSHHIVQRNAFNIDTEIVGITATKLALQILGNNAFIANNLFFLVSAWFLSEKAAEEATLNYSLKSCWKIEKIVLFYSISFCMVAYACGRGYFNLLAQSLLPTLFGVWWYPTTYIVFLMIWPFYHKALISFSTDELKKCIIVMFVLWSASALVPYSSFGADNFTAFLLLYVVAVYIKRVDIQFKDHKKVVVGMIVIPYIFGACSIAVLDIVGIYLPNLAVYSCYYMRGNCRPVSMLTAIGLFIWAKSWKISDAKWINVIADRTFAVYLIHMYPSVRDVLFAQLFVLGEVVNTPYAVPFLFGVTALIFTACVLIESGRKILFNAAARWFNPLTAKYSSAVIIDKILDGRMFSK